MQKIRTTGVIATYNHERFVEESVLSLANQVDELIVVDDYSLDNTQDILRGLKVPNLRLILHEENKGVSSSYNEAIALSEADIIVIQGGDDRSLPGRVTHQLRHLSLPGPVVSFGRPVVIDANGDVLPNEAAPEFFQEIEMSGTLPHLYFVGNFVCAPSVALRKSDFENLGGFNAAISYLQDYELWLKFAAVGKFVQSDKPLVQYRKHANNLSRDDVSKSITYSARFEAELEYILSSTIRSLDRPALESLGVELGLPGADLDHMDAKLLLALIQLSHSNVTQVRRGLSSLLEIVGLMGNMEILKQYGIDNTKLDEYARICDHKNTSSNSRIDFRLRKILD
jgi:glycosyltransferase involved in cell wall biosynthesis